MVLGPNRIENKMLKLFAEELANLITVIFNSRTEKKKKKKRNPCLVENIGNNFSVLKGDRRDIGNNRPINLVSNIGR